MQRCFEKFCKKDRNLKDKECSGQPIESNNWSCSHNYTGNCWRAQCQPFYGQSAFEENWKGEKSQSVGSSWADQRLKKKKIISLKCCLLLSYATTVNHFMTGLCLVTKSIYLATTGDNKLSGWTVKKLQSTSQSQICTKKRSQSLFGGLLLTTTALWILGETVISEKYAQQLDESESVSHSIMSNSLQPHEL